VAPRANGPDGHHRALRDDKFRNEVTERPTGLPDGECLRAGSILGDVG
jgi:hypothetical protein